MPHENIEKQKGTVRKIIHLDMDMFFVAVEIRDNPSLSDKPVAIGGPRNKRGVLSTANYIARQFGVHSAMPTNTALQKCPNLILLPGNMEKYKAESGRIFQIFRSYTDLVEGLSLDEAYLDVSNLSIYNGSATLIAKEIKSRVLRETGLTVSAGVGPNKLIAKLASDFQKPNGLTVVKPDQIDAFIQPLNVSKLFGVGKVAQTKLAKLNIHTCLDLQGWNLFDLTRHFGSFGQVLFNYCRGIDHREVKPHRKRKSFSLERTYEENLMTWEEVHKQFLKLQSKWVERWERWLLANPQKANEIIGLRVKIRSGEFETKTVEAQSSELDLKMFDDLIHEAYSRLPKPVRLLGLGVKLKEPIFDEKQMDLFE